MRKGVGFRVVLDVYDTTGVAVSGSHAVTAQVSKDGGSYAVTTNTPATASSAFPQTMSFLLTDTEANADTIHINAGSLNCIIPPQVFYPESFYTSAKAGYITGPIALEATSQTMTGNQQSILTAIGNIGTAGGAALNKDASTSNSTTGGISGVTSGYLMLGSQTNDYTSTSNINSIYHTITSTGASGAVTYQFACGGGTSPVEAIWVGYVQSGNDTINVSAWRHDTGAWENLRTIVGTAGATIQTINATLYARHMGTSSAELGKVYIRLWTFSGTSPVIATDQIKVAYSVTSRTVGYADGAVWINTLSGTSGTEIFVNGTADNPCLTLADALTIATSLGTSRFRVSNNSTITLASATATKTFIGNNWHLALNSQDITHSVFEGAEVSGIGSATDIVEFIDCRFTTATLPPATIIEGVLTSNTGGGITCAASGDYYFLSCYSGIAGNARPTITFAPSANVNLRNYSGGITLENMGAGSNASVEGRGNLVISANCSAGNVVVRGLFSLTNSSISPFVTVTDTARFATDQSLKLTSDYEAAKTAAPSGTALSNLQWTNALTGIINTNTVSLTSAAITAIANEILTIDWTTVDEPAARSMLNALRTLRNKNALVGSTLTIYKEDDSTSAWTASVSGEAAAIPITLVDPA
jgi:hypothetical protein